ncbi:hypothetical protein SERLA73DRAFT_177602 [Serpula lacrymans var. lacrymans S7.3]|uniref:Uncharacterized protein n=2 Tax=Serpula lacrymans var. lacrymans TaxID=341189 RepID=F8PP68_SERL3|nr:uncharacterized protein SERLADRAFT_461272 [Serpula lacrymans var. lacrymans S7.9]EGO01945.1 hypothetical protein SERLA73DRAFT_177602 [Serpula lacrymans var. lacrymans S7.3]EGO27571.1 hypothetical protein SERLADRAFT_461272 [Serpula lacrymans var. lacrymans S7.9]
MATQRQQKLIVLLLALLCIVLPIHARSASNTPHLADPFADPKHDPYNPLKYIASNTLTAIAFTLVMVVALTQSYWTYRFGAKWMLSMVIGEYTFALGIGTRFGLHYHPDSEPIYIIEYLFVVLSPCAFIAANYVLLGRMARHTGCSKHLLIPANRITKIFVASDVTTFLIQAAGGGLLVSTNPSTALTGSHIFLAGLVLQLVSFFSFSCLFCFYIYRVYTSEPEVWTRDTKGVAKKPWFRDWRTLAGALGLSCIGILIRSVYRVAELSQGFQGYLATTEAFFYGLDTLPLFIAISVYVPFWPAFFIPPVQRTEVEVSKEAERDSTEGV